MGRAEAEKCTRWWVYRVNCRTFLSAGVRMANPSPLVGIIMGSKSDQPTLQHAAETLGALGVAYEMRIVSAHRTPELMVAYAKGAEGRGLEVIIAGAGGAAHLPGMTASLT